MRGNALRSLLLQALPVLAQARDELRALDAAIGDGDLGITVSKGCAAVVEELATLPDDVTSADVLKATARRFASANPSTMSALVAAALLAVVKDLGSADVDRAGAVRVVSVASARIMERGGAQLGDKTVLDALVPSGQALAASDGDTRQALDAMIDAAADGVRSTASAQSMRGRAAWVGERTRGHADGGATAYLRLLEALRVSWPAP